MSYKLFIVYLLLAILLTACSTSTPIPATPIPTQQVWRVAYTAPLAILAQDFPACLDPNSNVAILIDEVPDSSGFDGHDFGFYWGDIQGINQATFVLGYDQLYVIVNNENSIDEISLGDIQAVFNGSINRWDQLVNGGNNPTGNIHVWLYPQEDILYREAIQTGLIKQDIHTSTTLAPDPDAMRVEIEDDPNAIGILPGIWLSNGVKKLQIMEGNSQNTQQPILVLTPDKPQGIALDWLLCLQKVVSDHLSQ
jgi:uncharacterized protein YcfL